MGLASATVPVIPASWTHTVQSSQNRHVLQNRFIWVSSTELTLSLSFHNFIFGRKTRPSAELPFDLLVFPDGKRFLTGSISWEETALCCGQPCLPLLIPEHLLALSQGDQPDTLHQSVPSTVPRSLKQNQKGAAVKGAAGQWAS